MFNIEIPRQPGLMLRRQRDHARVGTIELRAGFLSHAKQQRLLSVILFLKAAIPFIHPFATIRIYVPTT